MTCETMSSLLSLLIRTASPRPLHKRGTQASSSTGRLGDLKPSLGPAAKKRNKTFKVVTYSMRNTGVTSPDSYFYRAGLSQAAEQHLEKVGTGTAMVPNDVLYGFLKIGISVHEAGLLSDMGYPDAESLMTDPQLAEALPGTLVRTIRWGGPLC